MVPSPHSCSVFVGVNHFSGGLQSSKRPVLDKKCAGGPILRWCMGNYQQQRLEEMGDHRHKDLTSTPRLLSGLKSYGLWASHVKGWCFQRCSLLQWGNWS